MQFDFHRVFILIFASFVAVASCPSLRAGDDKDDKQVREPTSVVNDLCELSEIVIPIDEPLDLTELLRSLGEILALDDVPVISSTPLLNSIAEPQGRVKLVGGDEPILIGTGDEIETAETAKRELMPQPSNPLRNASDKPVKSDENKKPDDSKVATSPEKPKPTDASSEPLTLSFDEATATPKLSEAGPRKSANVSDRPKPKMVVVKPIGADEQESPRLSSLPREIDAKQARDEDDKAIVARRPEASVKTFVGKPSSGRITSQSGSSSNPMDTARSKRVESCLSYYMANPESVVERSPWAVMHAMLPFGVEGEIVVGNKRVNAIQWMCYNGTCRTQKLFTPAGKYFRPNVGGGVQGHEGQFLAMLAQSQVAANYPIVVGQSKYSVTDLIRYEMATCREQDELTFKLIGLSYYVDTEQVWSTDKRNRWNIEKLVEEELAQPINGAACGGTHRLMGLTFAIRQRKAEGRPIDGNFARADRYVKDFVDYAWKLQNPDGSFSTNWFESRGNEPNMERKVQTTGHILEWLAFTVSDDELTSTRFTKSIDFLLSQIWDQRQNKWPIGPRGHATRAIALYHQRLSGISPGQRHTQMAEQIQSLRLTR